MSLIDNLNEHGVKFYAGTVDEDIAITHLWHDLQSTGEITKLVATNAYSLSGFFSLLKLPNVAFYTQRGQDIESLHWLEQVSTSADAIFFSSWWRPDGRGSKRHSIVSSLVYQLVFSLDRKLIIGITKQENLLPLHKKIGYHVHEPIPYLFNGQTGWIMHLTEHDFKNGQLYKAAKEALNETE